MIGGYIGKPIGGVVNIPAPTPPATGDARNFPFIANVATLMGR